MIRLESVGLQYRPAGAADPGGPPQNALCDISFSVPAGGFRWLLGESGAGKSSLLGLLHLAVRPTHGRLAVLGRDIPLSGGAGMRHHLPLLRRRIGMVFQDFRLLAHLTAFENVAAPLRLAGRAEAELREDVTEMLAWVGLAHHHDALPAELSGGEQQRVAIARAVVGRPSLLLADEPTGNLDDTQAQRVMRLLHEMNKFGATVIMATHNDRLVARHPAPLLRLSHGRLVADAPGDGALGDAGD